MKSYKLFLLFVVLSVSSLLAQTKWNVDASHSNVGFEVEHMIITTVEGEFKKFDGTIESTGEDFSDAKINFTVDVASISTDNEQRDKHLKSDDFFNTDKYPAMIFTGKSIKKVDDNNWKLVGNFTIRDVTKEVTLDVQYKGTINDPWGNSRAGFKITGSINRFDYNLKWNKMLETGGLVVGDNVELIINLELIKSNEA